jgi:poly(hydroxyalkanoate) depolymerase family esterase
MKADIMNLALRLTRGGKLLEATKAIQEALAPASPRVPDGVAKTDKRQRPSRPLGEVVAKLGKIPKLLRTTQSPKLPMPAGAKFEDGSFTCAAGTRTYKLYVPGSLPDDKPGLIVMLHGCTQNAADFAAGTRMNELAETEGLLVVYPNQSARANSSGCWNWFNAQDQVHGRGEPSIIAGITQHVVSRYDVDPQRVFIAGLSAGGAMAVVMGHTYPNLYSAIGVHSGLPYQAASDVISAFAAMRGDARKQSAELEPRVIVFHGDADKTVHPTNGAAIVGAGLTHATKTVEGISADGRKYTRTIMQDDNSQSMSEHWLLHGAGHAWAGGNAAGSYTDGNGPDASKEMVRFFLDFG